MTTTAPNGRKAEIDRLRAELSELQRWRAGLADGTGAVRVRAVAVVDPRGVERIMLGCPALHETPAEAGECCDDFGIAIRTGLGKNGFAVSTDDDEPVVNIWHRGNVAVTVSREGITRYGADEQPITSGPTDGGSERAEMDALAAELDYAALQLRAEADRCKRTARWLREHRPGDDRPPAVALAGDEDMSITAVQCADMAVTLREQADALDVTAGALRRRVEEGEED